MNRVTTEDRKRFEQLDYYISIGWGHVASTDIERWERRNKRRPTGADRPPYGSDRLMMARGRGVSVVTLAGKSQSIGKWAAELHRSKYTLQRQIQEGWGEEKILSYRSPWGGRAKR